MQELNKHTTSYWNFMGQFTLSPASPGRVNLLAGLRTTKCVVKNQK